MSIFSRTENKLPNISVRTDPEFGEIKFHAVRKVRSIRVFVIPFEGVVIKFPRGVPAKKITSFIDIKRVWIRQALVQARITELKSMEHFSAHSAPPPVKIRVSLATRLDELARTYNFNYNKISIRNQKSRWGSCSAQNNISLNQKLFYLPDELRDYVLVHELAHTVEKNHSPAFWEILFKIYGKMQTGKMRRELKSFDYLFYPPPPM